MGSHYPPEMCKFAAKLNGQIKPLAASAMNNNGDGGGGIGKPSFGETSAVTSSFVSVRPIVRRREREGDDRLCGQKQPAHYSQSSIFFAKKS